LPIGRSWGRLALVTAKFESEQPQEEPLPAEHEPLLTPRRWVGLVLLALLLTFLVQNGKSVRMHFVGLNFSLPLGVALVISAITGALIALLATAARRRRLRARDRRR
jgi:uncharacterized integral membrane protein